MIKAIISHSQAWNRLATGRLITGMDELKYLGAEDSFSYYVWIGISYTSLDPNYTDKEELISFY